MNQEACAPSVLAAPRPIVRWLTTPWVDKTLGILALIPFGYPIVMHFERYFKTVETFYLVETLFLIGIVVFRRPAERVSTNPLYWLLAFVTSYWGLLTLSIEQPGHAVVSVWFAVPIVPISAVLLIWARLSLGRNFGLVPAQRQIVERGAYRWMRHPIYTAYFLATVVSALGSYTPRNLLVYSLGVVLQVCRSFAEEEFLSKDPAYSAYMQRVPWRWIPGVI
jgi:protein-S-isoprenylcysteine O-methyltransferase Ste14